MFFKKVSNFLWLAPSSGCGSMQSITVLFRILVKALRVSANCVQIYFFSFVFVMFIHQNLFSFLGLFSQLLVFHLWFV